MLQAVPVRGVRLVNRELVGYWFQAVGFSGRCVINCTGLCVNLFEKILLIPALLDVLGNACRRRLPDPLQRWEVLCSALLQVSVACLTPKAF